MLSLIIWLPILTAVLLMIGPRENHPLSRSLSLLTLLVTLGLSLGVFCNTPFYSSSYQFETNLVWEPSLGIHYHLGVKGMGATLILLTSLVGLVAILLTPPQKQSGLFHGLALIIIGGLSGAFASLDILMMFVFHEFALIPTFILVGIWGLERRQKAAMKITLYLAFGSLVLLLGILDLYASTGSTTFDLVKLTSILQNTPLSPAHQIRLFAVLFLGFGILVSLVPFHTWAPVGYAEAPPLAAMLHAGVIKKFGLFGIITMAIPLLPEGFKYWQNTIAWLGVGNLVFCGYVALQQKDVRYMLAYSSISHMGYAFLAIAAWPYHPGISAGLTLFMLAHGLSAALGFGVTGYFRQQTQTTEFSGLGGLAKTMPFTAAAFSIAAFAGCGLPGLASFPAELLIFFGSFRPYPWQTILALWTVVISATYYLRAVSRIFHGPLPSSLGNLRDPDPASRLALAILIAGLLTVGFFPSLVIGNPASPLTALFHP